MFLKLIEELSIDQFWWLKDKLCWKMENWDNLLKAIRNSRYKCGHWFYVLYFINAWRQGSIEDGKQQQHLEDNGQQRPVTNILQHNFRNVKGFGQSISISGVGHWVCSSSDEHWGYRPLGVSQIRGSSGDVPVNLWQRRLTRRWIIFPFMAIKSKMQELITEAEFHNISIRQLLIWALLWSWS